MSQITGYSIIFSTVCSRYEQMTYQRYALLSIFAGKPLLMRKAFPCHDVFIYVICTFHRQSDIVWCTYHHIVPIRLFVKCHRRWHMPLFSFNTSTVLPPQHTHTYAHSAWNGVLAVYFYGPEYITDLSPMDTYQSDSLAIKIIPYLCNKIHIAIPRVQNYADVQHKASVFFLYKTHISSVT